jgi:MoxR-like ATPase
MTSWHIFRKSNKPYNEPHDDISELPDPPSWRSFTETEDKTSNKSKAAKKKRGATYQAQDHEIDLVNAALYLRRPLLVTGKPGTGKTSLAYAVAYQLKLGEVLYWPITTRTTLRDGLYRYDAIGRAQDTTANSDNLKNIGKYIQLGPLGTALLPSNRPRVLLIDEIDKGDIDLPNDLLHAFEEGNFEIPELMRIAGKTNTKTFPNRVAVRTAYRDATEPTYADNEWNVDKGLIQCTQFPFVIMTSNGERDFPPPFLRRCLQLEIKEPEKDELEKIIRAHFDLEGTEESKKINAAMTKLIDDFLKKRKEGELATDQLLNALYLLTRRQSPTEENAKMSLTNAVLQYLNRTDGGDNRDAKDGES